MTFEQGSKPPEYDELFIGFAGLAALHGTIDYGPLDPAYAPGIDGTLTPDGEQATGYDWIITECELPKAILDLGVDRVDIGRYSATILGKDVWPERVWVDAHEPGGYTKETTFSKSPKTGKITAGSKINMDDPPSTKIGVGLGDDETEAIILDIFAGKEFWLHLEGPHGEFARAVYTKLNSSDESLYTDEIERLHKIYEALKK